MDWSSVLLSAQLEPTRIGSHKSFVREVAVWRGRICSASDDGLIHIWGRAAYSGCELHTAGGNVGSVHQQVEPEKSLDSQVPEKTLDGQAGAVWALISWNGWLVSAGVDSLVRVIIYVIPAFAISGFM